MARVTKAELETELKELKTELEKYRKWLFESEEKYNKLIDEKEILLEELPVYKQAMSRNNRLESINTENIKIIDKLKQQRADLQKQVSKLEKENSQLKENIKEKIIINDTPHNARGAGRKPKPNTLIQLQLNQITSLMNQGYTVNTICTKMNISKATYYRLLRSKNNRG